MPISDLLGPEAVRVLPTITSKKRLFNTLSELAERVYDLSSDRVCEALLDREALGPTGVGRGVALPHARLSGPDRVCGVFLRLEKPIDFGAPDRQPVDLIFSLFAPLDAGVEHLRALAVVSRTMRDADLCATLRSGPDADTLYAALTQKSSIHAA